VQGHWEGVSHMLVVGAGWSVLVWWLLLSCVWWCLVCFGVVWVFVGVVVVLFVLCCLV